MTSKSKKILLVCIIILPMIITLAALQILGSKERIGYIEHFNESEADSVIDTKNEYRYGIRINYYDKIFRNSDIFGVYPNNETLPEYIVNVDWKEAGSPYGALTSIKEISPDKKIDIRYKTKIRNVIWLCAFLLFALVCLVIFFRNKLYFMYKFILGTPEPVSVSDTIDTYFSKRKKSKIILITTTFVVLFVYFFNIHNGVGGISGDDFSHSILESSVLPVYKAWIAGRILPQVFMPNFAEFTLSFITPIFGIENIIDQFVFLYSFLAAILFIILTYLFFLWLHSLFNISWAYFPLIAFFSVVMSASIFHSPVFYFSHEDSNASHPYTMMSFYMVPFTWILIFLTPFLIYVCSKKNVFERYPLIGFGLMFVLSYFSAFSITTTSFIALSFLFFVGCFLILESYFERGDKSIVFAFTNKIKSIPSWFSFYLFLYPLLWFASAFFDLTSGRYRGFDVGDGKVGFLKTFASILKNDILSMSSVFLVSIIFLSAILIVSIVKEKCLKHKTKLMIPFITLFTAMFYFILLVALGQSSGGNTIHPRVTLLPLYFLLLLFSFQIWLSLQNKFKILTIFLPIIFAIAIFSPKYDYNENFSKYKNGYSYLEADKLLATQIYTYWRLGITNNALIFYPTGAGYEYCSIPHFFKRYMTDELIEMDFITNKYQIETNFQNIINSNRGKWDIMDKSVYDIRDYYNVE